MTPTSRVTIHSGVIFAVAQPTPTPNIMAGNRMIMLRLS